MRTALVTVLAVVLVCGCADQPTSPTTTAPGDETNPMLSATSEWVNELIPFAIPGWYLDCLNEAVLWTGQVQFTDHIVTNPDGSVQINGKATLLPGSTLVGPSGTWVDPKVMNHYNIGNGQGSYYVNERIRWTHQNSGARMDVWTKIHFVAIGDGELKVVQDTEGATCVLRG